MGKKTTMDQFVNKIAIVTSGASGIGRALCEVLGRRGAVVIVADIVKDGAERTAATITQNKGWAQAKTVDVTRPEEVERLISDTVSVYGRIDYLFNNAGICIVGDTREIDLELWRRIVDVNLWGVIYGTTMAYRQMARQGFGHIVNTASLAGLISSPTFTSYATTKHAVVGLSRSLRAEAEDLGVKVSAVCPGFVRTGMFDSCIILKAKREEANNQVNPRMILEPSQAAQHILRGVEQNQALIVFPWYSHMIMWISRCFPSLMFALERKSVRDFRKMCDES